MSDYKPSPTPFEFSLKLTIDCDTPLVDATSYRQLAGSLIYLSHNKLDISYKINMVSRFMKNPYESH